MKYQEQQSSLTTHQNRNSNGANQKWLTAHETARHLGISVQGVYNLVWCGKLTRYKPFGRLLFKRTELDQMIEASRKGGIK